MLSQQNPNFNRYLKEADLLLADGMSVVWASRVLTALKKSPQSISQRIAGVDLAEDLIRFSDQHQLKILVIGGRDYQETVKVSSKTVLGQQNLWQLADNLFWTSGFQDVSVPQDQEQSALKDCLLKIKPDIVFVAFGAPHQEKWLISNRELLNQAGTKLAMGVGGAFDIIFGRLKRAPVWMQRLGLEWLFRLIQEPWRWKRQLRLVEFMKLIISKH